VKTDSPGILHIEGDYDDANMMSRILRKYRIANHLETAADGEEALRLLRAGFPGRLELVLIGFAQTGRPALETAIQIRGLPGLDQVPIIVCCGTPEEDQQAKQWGIRRFATMSKPAGFFKLLECIQKLEMHWQVFGSRP
jgi:hypothetical protein